MSGSVSMIDGHIDEVLKPCPFCGGEAKVSLLLGNYGVACCNCAAAILNCPYQTKKEAIEAWNRRADT